MSQIPVCTDGVLQVCCKLPTVDSKGKVVLPKTCEVRGAGRERGPRSLLPHTPQPCPPSPPSHPHTHTQVPVLTTKKAVATTTYTLYNQGLPLSWTDGKDFVCVCPVPSPSPAPAPTVKKTITLAPAPPPPPAKASKLVGGQVGGP